MEIDNVRNSKSRRFPARNSPAPFVLVGDPIWSLAKEPIRFNGDGKFYFFDRNVGYGEAVTVAFTMNPERRANAISIARRRRPAMAAGPCN